MGGSCDLQLLLSFCCSSGLDVQISVGIIWATRRDVSLAPVPYMLGWTGVTGTGLVWGGLRCLLLLQTFQRQVHERLTQLELLNKQYRRLAREGRTDGAGALRDRVQEGNRRWDGLQRRVAAIVRRLRVRRERHSLIM